MKKIALLFICSLIGSISISQSCNVDSLKTIITRASDTDPNISFELKQHYSFFNPTCVSRNTLMIFMGGSFGKPGNYLLFPELAANNGFNVINIHYPNNVASKLACGSSSDSTCFSKFRKEIIEGVDYSPTVTVDSNNCINNRVIKLLQYLHTNHPTQNWSNFYSGNTVDWSKVIVSGHSQGGGHAAYIGVTNRLKRVIMFASPNDYNNNLSMAAPWTLTSKITPDSLYYGLVNKFDDVVNSTEQFQIWNNLNMPAYGDTIDVDVTSYPYSNSRQLYSQLVDLTSSSHSTMILDSDTPLVGGKSIYTPVWKYLLGIENSTSLKSIDEQIDFILFPNPSRNELNIKTNVRIDGYSITNLYGKVIRISRSDEKLIESSELTPGIYFLTIESEGRQSTKRFIKL